MSIKEKLSKEEAVRRHRELWNKIAELCTGGFNVGMIKTMALNDLGYYDSRDYPTNRCWACEYAKNNAIYLRRNGKSYC